MSPFSMRSGRLCGRPRFRSVEAGRSALATSFPSVPVDRVDSSTLSRFNFRTTLRQLMALVLLGAAVTWVFVLASRWAFFRKKADAYSVRERIFVEALARLRRIPEYRQLECEPSKVGTVMLMAKGGGQFCVDRPGFYLREIARFRVLKEIYSRAANHPWDSVGPMPERDELGGVWTWNWFVRVGVISGERLKVAEEGTVNLRHQISRGQCGRGQRATATKSFNHG